MEIVFGDKGSMRIRVRRLKRRVQTLDDLVQMLRRKKLRVLVLAGAGISVSSVRYLRRLRYYKKIKHTTVKQGIPDFRSDKGIYNTLDTEAMGLSQPEELFDIHFFKHNPIPFYKFAKDLIYGKKHEPTPTHYFIRRLESEKKLRRMYTQNIDGLENRAGIKRVVYCHGSLTYATCLSCKSKVKADEIRNEILEGHVPYCVKCNRGLMKPSIKFFGEKLNSRVGTFLEKDKEHVDLIMVFGTSLKVAPISHVLNWLGSTIPRVLINRERVDISFDLELLGDCDIVVKYICDLLDNASKSIIKQPRKHCTGTFLFENAVVPVSSSSSFFLKKNGGDNGHFICDACSGSIFETRYHCMVCFDYDLCKSCVCDRSEHEVHRKRFGGDISCDHTFKKIDF